MKAYAAVVGVQHSRLWASDGHKGLCCGGGSSAPPSASGKTALYSGAVSG